MLLGPFLTLFVPRLSDTAARCVVALVLGPMALWVGWLTAYFGVGIIPFGLYCIIFPGVVSRCWGKQAGMQAALAFGVIVAIGAMFGYGAFGRMAAMISNATSYIALVLVGMLLAWPGIAIGERKR